MEIKKAKANDIPLAFALIKSPDCRVKIAYLLKVGVVR